jgi:hypothetical protein
LWNGAVDQQGKLDWPDFLQSWAEQDRPKWYRDLLEKSEGRYTAEDISKLPLPQLAALSTYRNELTLAEAIQQVKERKHGKTS